MKTIMLLTGGGPVVILTSFAAPTDPGLLTKLRAKGITKFIAYEVPLELAMARYGAHFSIVQHDLHENDDLRVLDYNGDRAFNLFRFDEMSGPVVHEAEAAPATASAAAAAPAPAMADDTQ